MPGGEVKGCGGRLGRRVTRGTGGGSGEPAELPVGRWCRRLLHCHLPTCPCVAAHSHSHSHSPPLLPPPHTTLLEQMVDDKLSVSELMTTSLIALPPVVPVRRVVDVLRMCAHQAFPVTPQVDRALADSGGCGAVGCGSEGEAKAVSSPQFDARLSQFRRTLASCMSACCRRAV